MKRYSLTILCFLPTIMVALLLWLGAMGQLYAASKDDSYQATCRAYFSPAGGCTQAIIDTLADAKKTVLVQAYSFTSAPIAKALLEAHKRGVDVKVLLDKSNRTEKYSSADFLNHAGIPTFIDDKHAIAHNKIMVIDGKRIITGSFNFTAAAEAHNAENLLILDSTDLATRYTANWQAHREHSKAYTDHKQAQSTHTRSAATTPSGQAQDVTVYITQTGHKYHRAGCSSLSRSQIPMSLKDAKAKGYTPCQRCNLSK